MYSETENHLYKNVENVSNTHFYVNFRFEALKSKVKSRNINRYRFLKGLIKSAKRFMIILLNLNSKSLGGPPSPDLWQEPPQASPQ